LLSGGAHDLPARHQTLRAALAWSYDLLSPDERKLFARLAAFSGGWTLDAAEAVCLRPGGIDLDVVDGLASLSSKNLVRRDEQARDEPRVRMLETMREFARERLVAGDMADAVLRSHAAFFQVMAEQSEVELTGPRQAEWCERLERERDNFRAALRWSIEAGETEAGLRLAGALWQFWWLHGYLTEGRTWLSQLLARSEALPHRRERAKALLVAGLLAVWQGDYAAARPLLAESLSSWRAAGDERSAAHALIWLGRAARDQGDDAAARAAGEESIALLRRTDDTWGLAVALHFFGLAVQSADLARARACFEESAALFRALGDRHGLAMPLRGLGIVAYQDRDYDTARARFEESATRFREFGDDWSCAMALRDLGNVARQQGDLARAAALFVESLTLWRRVGNVRGNALCLAGLAGVAALAGQAERAARLFGAAETLRSATGGVLEPTDRAVYELNVAAARHGLDGETFASAWAAGTTLSLEQAITDALAVAECVPPPQGKAIGTAAEQDLACLTPREREVAALLARGLSNRRIGAALVITEGTAGLHVKHILGKLSFTSRAQIAAWAVQHGLLDAPPALMNIPRSAS
jgi:non-specific serine/threonine protein kinase